MGFSDAANELGFIYELGEGKIKVNIKNATKYYRKGWEMNNHECGFNLAKLLKESNLYLEAISVFETLIEQKEFESSSHYHLAKIYMDTQNVECFNSDKAKNHLEQSLDHIMSIIHLAELYAFDKYNMVDLNLSKKYLKMAEDLNDDVIIGRIHKLNIRYKELGV